MFPLKNGTSSYLSHTLHDRAFRLSTLAFVVGIYVLTRTRSHSQHQRTKVIASPKITLLPKLSKSEVDALPYPPDVFPGARDVNSPYGSLRVYEWGPEDGRKVLLIHGISTPCIALGAVAHGLVDKGCRVMLFDLWGRGYSDSPISLPHDSRLYTTSILLALTSSQIPWTGNTTFSLLGYSLGGGIAAAFASYFPNLVSSLILIAPSGLLRPYHTSFSSRMLYSTGLLPEFVLEWLVRRRLRGDPAPAKPVDCVAAGGAVSDELPDRECTGTVLSRNRPGITAASAVAWQLENHQGLMKSFMSSIRCGPITNQHEDWRRIREGMHLRNSKVLIICGESDPIIFKDELVEDATSVLGKDGVNFRFCECGHDVPIAKSQEVIDHIYQLWEEKRG